MMEWGQCPMHFKWVLVEVELDSLFMAARH